MTNEQKENWFRSAVFWHNRIVNDLNAESAMWRCLLRWASGINFKVKG